MEKNKRHGKNNESSKFPDTNVGPEQIVSLQFAGPHVDIGH